MSCQGLEADTLTLWLAGGLGEQERAAIASHLDECTFCHELVGLLAQDARPASVEAEGEKLAPGQQLGRYTVDRCIGSGAMGVVYAAEDTQLHRKVAIKVLRSSDQDPVALLEREARALASLAHPNIVSVFDVGHAGPRVFMAMEFVEGVSLREWLSKRPPIDAIVDAFTQAGRGLAAAHARGIVHRDFKPDNVLMGADGRVRVVDFGLARKLTASGDRLQSVPTGTVAGTPAYMAPEVRRGEKADARTDQYSFAMAFDESLSDSNLDAAGTSLVARCRPILSRALSPTREARFPTMAALLVALDGATAPRRPTAWPAWVVAAIATCAAVAIALTRTTGNPPNLSTSTPATATASSTSTPSSISTPISSSTSMPVPSSVSSPTPIASPKPATTPAPSLRSPPGPPPRGAPQAHPSSSNETDLFAYPR